MPLKKITLTEQGINSGPVYGVYTSTDGVTYTFLQNITLPTIGAYAIVEIPYGNVTVELTSLGLCNNSVIHTIPGSLLADFSLDFSQLDFN